MHILHPVEVRLGEAFGDELDAPVLHNVDRLFCQRFHFDKPLRAGHRFHGRTTAIAAADVVAVVLHLDEIALFFEILYNLLTALITVHPVIAAAAAVIDDLRILVDDLHHLKVVAKADFIVVRIMTGSHLHCTSAKAQLHIVIRDDRELSAHERQDGILANQMLIFLIRRVDGDTGVAQHRLRTGGGDDEFLIGIFHRITDVPEVARDILVFHFRIGKCCAAVRAPVDNSPAFIDQALFVEIAEGFANGSGTDIIHREAGTAPVG